MGRTVEMVIGPRPARLVWPQPEQRAPEGRLPAGSRLQMRYKGTLTQATVVQTEEGTGIRVGKRTYPSPSSAAKAVMGGASVNGWAAWRFEGRPIGTLRGE